MQALTRPDRPYQSKSTELEAVSFAQGLNQVSDLSFQLGLARGTALDLPAASPARPYSPGRPDFRNCRFQVPTDCSETLARRAASAPATSPSRIDNTILVVSSAGNVGGLAIINSALLLVTGKQWTCQQV